MKVCYINIDTKNPRDIITLRGFKENNIEVFEITDSAGGIQKYRNIIKKYRALPEHNIVMIGYTGSLLVPVMRFVSRKKVVYNALATFYESMIVSRGVGSRFSPKAIYYWLIDWCSFHFCHHATAECESQKRYICQTFFVNPKRISVHVVGVDDREFFHDPLIQKLPNFTIVFRGKFLPEAGTDVIIRAAKLVEDKGVNVRVIGHGLLQEEIVALVDELKPRNLDLITEVLPYNLLRQKMQECHVSLGQMADHPRLPRTIPHKAFETISMKLPYLTGRQEGVLEVLKENETCICSKPGDVNDLVEKMLYLRDKPEIYRGIAEKGYALYLKEYTPKELGKKIIAMLQSLIRA